MHKPFLTVENLCVTISGKEVLKNIHFTIGPNEQWALVGPTGSGKTVFADTLAGNHYYQGLIETSFGDAGHFHRMIAVVHQQHRFRNLQHRSDFYYQQRYQSMDAAATITVGDDLDQYPEFCGNFSKTGLLDQLHLRQLREEPLIQLSSGENKRLQIAKALLTTDRLLVLDQPFTGLDAEGRELLGGILQTLVRKGTRLLLITSPRDMPSCISHIAGFRNGMIEFAGPASAYRAGSQAAISPPAVPLPPPPLQPVADFDFAVRMVNVSVEYEHKQILQQINWEVGRGSCWSLSGPNGAGKSTLLSLITGDNPQAYANEIYLFDRRRGTGESIWDIKARIGFLSAELHLYFDPAATCYQALASGFFDTIGLFRRLSPEQETLVAAWLEYLGVREDAGRLLNQLPAGMQRLLLLARAMIKCPPLLVLDEPCQGLDSGHIERVKEMISRYCREREGTLIYVSHYTEELPRVIDHYLRLDRGMVS
jgi:molybdate transport system ATP-binding protein